METSELVAWVCSSIVVFSIAAFVIFEVLNRWRIGLRLASLDESLLNDDRVSVEDITDAPDGSLIVGGMIAEYVDGDL
tara:strand:- start:62 stop:295 length:234 start_codon:yes stop_codon:yes gene_type:complete